MHVEVQQNHIGPRTSNQATIDDLVHIVCLVNEWMHQQTDLSVSVKARQQSKGQTQKERESECVCVRVYNEENNIEKENKQKPNQK